MKNSISKAALALIIIASFAAILGYRAKATATEATVSLPNPAVDEKLASAPAEETAYFAGGCFWGIQAVFQHTKGVKWAISGYAGGKVANPSYYQVGSGETGHAESVRVVYDPSQITYGQLLKIFFSVATDPTQLNRQGPDVGTQYRSVLFYNNDSQKRIASAYIDQLTKARVFAKPIVTTVTQLQNSFYEAEGYHQDYARLHPYEPYIVINDAPKVENLKKEFPASYRD